MSEYQYYEFLAIDKPLTEEQLGEVERYSSRAEITARSFTNTYNYGNFRGDPKQFLAKYYDAMVYVANWGTHRFMFRVPATLIDSKLLDEYAANESLGVSKAGENVILNLVSNIEGGDWEEGEGWMEQLSAVREEVMQGDLRPLYLGWLAGFSDDFDPIDEETVEPPVPPGLGKLTKAQRALAEFLQIDDDLIAAAAQGSSETASSGDPGLAQWIAALPQAQKDQILLALVEGSDPHAAVALRRQFQQWRAAARPTSAAEDKARRTAAELLQLAEEMHSQREARQHAEQQATARAARAKKLADLAERGEGTWTEIDRLIDTKQSPNYDKALELLKDLEDLASESGRLPDFRQRVQALLARHSQKILLQKKAKSLGLTAGA